MIAGLGGASALAQSPFPAPEESPPTILEVPYLPQSVLLCGGAALAMVERWWGRRGVFAEDFVALVRPELGGILTGDLASAARARGWETEVMTGTAERVQRHLVAGEPVVALIQVSPGRFHYVVVLAWRDGKVTFHDPARSPFTTLDESRFLTRWSGADRWAMVIRPAPALVAGGGSDTLVESPADSLPCRPWLDRAVDAAIQQRLDQSLSFLEQASRSCPGEPLVLREMAGVRFKQTRYADASRLAAEYVVQAPGDDAGWRLLASSRYLTGDLDGALAAWNRLGLPRVDLVRIDGTRGIRYREIAEAAALPPGTVLTAGSLALARRRVSDVPGLRIAAMKYQPVPGGLVEVHVAVDERPVMDPLWRLAATGAVRALAHHEAGIEVASPTGGGEVWSAGWRWESARPRVAVRLDTPGHLLFPGVLVVESSWERFRAPGVDDTRRSTSAGFGGWLTASWRPSAWLGVERWSEDREYVAVSLGTELSGWSNRLRLRGLGSRALATSAQRSYTRAGLRAAWASAPGLGRGGWSVRTGVEWASRDAPAGSWPVAGGAVSWAVPLRAHSLDGSELLLGRTIAHGGLAGDHPLTRVGLLVLAAGAFLDAARVSGIPASPASRWHVDGGFGIRLGIAEGSLGVLRVDLARGLMGGRRTTLSVGVHRSWPLD